MGNSLSSPFCKLCLDLQNKILSYLSTSEQQQMRRLSRRDKLWVEKSRVYPWKLERIGTQLIIRWANNFKIYQHGLLQYRGTCDDDGVPEGRASQPIYNSHRLIGEYEFTYHRGVCQREFRVRFFDRYVIIPTSQGNIRRLKKGYTEHWIVRQLSKNLHELTITRDDGFFRIIRVPNYIPTGSWSINNIPKCRVEEYKKSKLSKRYTLRYGKYHGLLEKIHNGLVYNSQEYHRGEKCDHRIVRSSDHQLVFHHYYGRRGLRVLEFTPTRLYLGNSREIILYPDGRLYKEVHLGKTLRQIPENLAESDDIRSLHGKWLLDIAGYGKLSEQLTDSELVALGDQTRKYDLVGITTFQELTQKLVKGIYIRTTHRDINLFSAYANMEYGEMYVPRKSDVPENYTYEISPLELFCERLCLWVKIQVSRAVEKGKFVQYYRNGLPRLRGSCRSKLLVGELHGYSDSGVRQWIFTYDRYTHS